jgi:tetratricopeptide (TPR) repeat protein
LSKPFQYLFFWTRWLWYPIVTIIAFLPVWFRSRSRASWIGSIALVAIAMTSVFLFLQFQRPLKLIRKSYQAAIDGALASKNFDLARKYQQKLLTLSSGSQYDVIRRITQLAESGSNAEAIAFAQQLVAQDSAASVDIHFWLAQQFATGKSQLPAAESVATAEYHLQQIDLILEKEIGLGGIPLPALQFLKATIDLQKNDVSAALIQLKDIDDYWPAVALQVELYALSQQPELALRKSVWLYKMAAQDRTLFSELNQDFYLLWSQVLIQGGAEQEFEDVILSWYRKYPEDSRAKLEFSMLQLVQVDRLLRVKVQADLNQASELLLEAVNRVGAEHHQLLSVWINQRMAPGNTPPRFPELVRMLEESNKTPSYLLEILGTAAFQAGDQSKALNLLTKATELDRNNLVAWNNLSYINSSIPDGNLQLALEAAERIVESEPGNLTFRKTRAQVNMKLKQWERAIEDLKLALAGDPGSTAINANLAVAYQNIGDERLAAWHRQLSEKQ